MPDLATIRAAIVARLSAVPSVGIVHDRQRYGKTDRDLKALYQSGATLLGWHLRRVRTIRASRGIRAWSVHHHWRIFGVRSFDDDGSSEIAFDTLIEAIRGAFDADDDLGGVVDTLTPREPNAASSISVLDAGPVLFAGVLCHGAELGLVTIHHE